MRNLLSFVAWLLKKWFVNEDGLYHNYERAVRREPFALFLLTILIYAGLWLASLLLFLAIDPGLTLGYALWSFLAVLMFGNYFRILLVAQYREFKQERHRLFNTIKHSHERGR